jgi:hypothetical protein
MSFAPIGDAIEEHLKQQSTLKSDLQTAAVLEYSMDVFSDLFPEELHKYIKPLFLKNRTLTVRCANKVMAQEIRTNQAEIVRQINDKLGSVEVDRIRYLP